MINKKNIIKAIKIIKKAKAHHYQKLIGENKKLSNEVINMKYKIKMRNNNIR